MISIITHDLCIRLTLSINVPPKKLVLVVSSLSMQYYEVCQYEYHDLSKINGFDELCKDSVSNSIIYQRIKQSLLTLTYLTQKTQRHPGLGQAQRGDVKPV
jgi:hypothetical protein